MPTTPPVNPATAPVVTLPQKAFIPATSAEPPVAMATTATTAIVIMVLIYFFTFFQSLLSQECPVGSVYFNGLFLT